MPDTATDQPAPAPLPPFTPEPIPPSSFADPTKARRAVPLANPIVVEGKTWDRIFVRRFTVDQVAVVMRNWEEEQKRNPDAQPAFPSFVDETGAEVSTGVMRLLDFDDMQEVQKAAQGFLPRMFRPSTEQPTESQSSSTSSTGDTTDPRS